MVDAYRLFCDSIPISQDGVTLQLVIGAKLKDEAQNLPSYSG